MDSFQDKKYSLHILYDGYSAVNSENNIMKANCTCTLLKSLHNNVIIDTMTAWDKNKIIDGLASHKLSPDDINYVICTHGHSDHIGNNNLFLNATHIVGVSVSKSDIYYLEPFNKGEKYIIDECLEILPTPGHTLSDVTIIVKTENRGICAIAGDLFECEDDINDPNIWINAGSESPEKQKYHRHNIAALVDWIVPGHGAPFQSSIDIRNKLKSQLENISI